MSADQRAPRRVKRRIWNERAMRWEEHSVLLCPRSDHAGKRRETAQPVYRRTVRGQVAR